MVRHYTIIMPRFRTQQWAQRYCPCGSQRQEVPQKVLTRSAQREPGQGHVAPHPDLHCALLPRSTGLLLSLEFAQNFPCVAGFGTPYRAAAEIAMYRGRGPGLPEALQSICYNSMHRYSYSNGTPVCLLSRDAVAVYVPEATPGDRGWKFR